MVELKLTGPLELRVDDRAVARLRSRKALLVLAVLHLAGRPTSRRTTADRMWPDSTPAAAAAELSRVVFDLRRHLGPALLADRHTVALAHGTVTSEVTAVTGAEASDDPAVWAAAVGAQRGPLLAEVDTDGTGLADWVHDEQRRHQGRVTALLERLVRGSADRPADRLRWARRWEEVDPWSDAAHQQVLLGLAATDAPAAALAHHRDWAARLRADLDVLPRPATLAVLESIRRRPAASIAPPSFPAPLTPIVGRDELIATVLGTLEGGARLVTLVGTGGVGKTRVALEVGGRLVAATPGSAVFVDLSTVEDADFLPEVTARALGRPTGVDPAGAVVRALADRRCVLVLDNLEHLPGAAATVLGWLTALPSLRVLVTSRGPLRLRGEHLVPVPTLPDAEARALFRARAAAADPEFERTADPGVVDAVCTRLDGLPLALELAAAQVALTGMDGLLHRLDDRLATLVGHETDRPARHRDLRETVLWSERLLGDDGRALFAALGAVATGVDDAVAAALLPRPGAAPAAVSTLIDAGLLLVSRGRRRPTYMLLPTVRDVALERLGADPHGVRDRHADHLLERAEAAGRPGVDAAGDDQAERLGALEDVLDDVRAALAHTRDRPGALVRWCYALETFWWLGGHRREAVGLLAAALADPDLDPAAEARLRHSAAHVTHLAGDLDGAFAHWARLVDLGDRHPGPATTARADSARASMAGHAGDLETLLAAAARAVEHGRRDGLPVLALMNAVSIIAVSPLLGRPVPTDLLADGLAHAETAGAMPFRNSFVNSAARQDLAAGDPAGALGRHADAAAFSVRCGEQGTLPYTTLYAAEAALALGGPMHAATLVAASDSLLADSGERLVGFVQPVRDTLGHVLDDRLGPDGRAGAASAGRAVRVASAAALVEQALADLAGRPVRVSAPVGQDRS